MEGECKKLVSNVSETFGLFNKGERTMKGTGKSVVWAMCGLLVIAGVAGAARINYRFDSDPASDSILYDSGPSGLNGLVGSASKEYVSGDYSGKVSWDAGNCLVLEKDDVATVSGLTTVFGSTFSAFTIEFWYGNNNFWDSSYQEIVTLGPAYPDSGLWIYTGNNDGNGVVTSKMNTVHTPGGSGTWIPVGGNAHITGADWHHLAYTYDGQDLKAYVDGALSDTVSAPGLTFDVGDLAFKGLGTNTRYIDDVRIYDWALSPSQLGYSNEFPVPEPATIGLLCIGIIGLLRRKP